MDDDYYALVRDNRLLREGLPLLSPEGLILLKARAWLDLTRRKGAGHPVDDRDIRKHRTDIFKLALLLTPAQSMSVAQSIHSDLLEFLGHFPADSPQWESIRQASGIKNRMPRPADLLAIVAGHFVTTDH